MGHAVVVGASLAGLMTALSLSRVGMSVTMLERSADTGRTGAALHVENGLLRKIMGTEAAAAREPLATGVQTWFTVYGSLRAAAESDPSIELHHHVSVKAVEQDDEAAWATTADGRIFRGDIIVGADGHNSIVRRRVSPDKPDARFAGYVIWLGVAQEASLPPTAHWPSDVAFLNSADYTLLGYPLPGNDGSLAPGKRQLGWAWYDAGRNRLLRETGCVVGNVVQHSLRADDIPERTYRELEVDARRWSPPWKDAVFDCINRHQVVGTPIAEYVPDRLVSGRMALVGDAAHVPTPMTGNGFSASLADAEALAGWVGAGLHQHSTVEEVLQKYQDSRLAAARGLVLSGQDFSRSFANGRT